MKLEVNSKPDLCSKVNYYVLWIYGLWNMWKFQKGFWFTDNLGGHFRKARLGITWSLMVNIRCRVHGVTKSQTRLSDFHFHFTANMDRAAFCQAPAVWRLHTAWQVDWDSCSLANVGGFWYCRQWTHLTWYLTILRQVVNHSKKRGEKSKPTAICLLCSLPKDSQSPQTFF